MDETKQRFAAFDVESCEKMKQKKLARNTENSTSYAARLINNFCKQSHILPGSKMLNELTAEEVLPVLIKFYMCARNEKGEVYKVNTMRSLRSSLQRYLLGLLKIDIINDRLFTEANVVFENVLKEIRSLGKGVTDHHPAVTTDDLRKLHAGFNIDDPRGLQELVWLHIMFLLIRVSRQNIRGMTKSTFAVATDSTTGRTFVYQKESGEDFDTVMNPEETTKEERIYETGGPKCPVACFQKYIWKLSPLLEALWQRPRTSLDDVSDTAWYCNVPHGEKFLGNMMSMLSKKYKLSQKYTNHCLKVTHVNSLDDVVLSGGGTNQPIILHATSDYITATPSASNTTHHQVILPSIIVPPDPKMRRILPVDHEKGHSSSLSSSSDVVENVVDASSKFQDDLNNAETSLVFAYKRIEKLKSTIETHKQNEEGFKSCLLEYQAKLHLSEERYNSLKGSVDEKFEGVRYELEQVKQQCHIDVSALRESLQKAQARIASLENQILHNEYDCKDDSLLRDIDISTADK